MKNRLHSLSRLFLRLTLASLLGLAAAGKARAQDAVQLTTLDRYVGTDLNNVSGALTLGRDGNLYGTTNTGGVNAAGSIFQIAPDGTLTTLHSFDANDAGNNVSTLVEGATGVFYGVCSDDGTAYDGEVFQITADGTFTVLHSFSDGEAYLPDTALVAGNNGDFYGTSFGGGIAGTVYRVSPAGDFTLLHSFTGPDGFLPSAALVLGSDGNFYGTTTLITEDDNQNVTATGTVFRISPAGDFTNLGSLNSGDGTSPNSALVEAADGNFYGTTANGVGSGTIFRVTPAGVSTVLHRFTKGLDGAAPTGLTLGADGNLYGMTTEGGLYDQNDGFGHVENGYGTIFQITPAGALTTLYNFTDGSDGAGPATTLVPDGKGGFYGGNGGDNTEAAGIIFQLAVISHPTFFTGQESFGNGFYFLQFPIGNHFGYYGFLDDPNSLYHVDLGYEYVFDAHDQRNGVYLYDFASDTFFYTSPVYPFPYLYDFTLHTVLYYYPDPNNAGRYTTNPRLFYDFATNQVISK